MPYAKGIVFALRPFGKAAEAIIFAIGGEFVPASGEDLVSVSLVTYVPYQLVIRGVENIMEGRRQLYQLLLECRCGWTSVVAARRCTVVGWSECGTIRVRRP